MKHLGPELKISPKKRIYTEEQKIASREAQRKRRAKNPERVRELGKESERRRRMRRYGISEEVYSILLEKQNNACAICSLTFKNIGRYIHIDHCHSTGKVRGILCHHCNILLGNAKDSVKTLSKAINYLKENSY